MVWMAYGEPPVCPEFMPGGSMYSLRWVSVLLFFSVFIAVIPVGGLADGGNHSPTMIIPTKYRLLLIDMIESLDTPAPPVIPPQESPKPEGSHEPVNMESEATDMAALVAGVTPDSSYNGYGRGYVETNFDVSLDAPGQKVRNNERLTARGLFDVHVSHGFN
jgi:hypothetical protein